MLLSLLPYPPRWHYVAGMPEVDEGYIVDKGAVGRNRCLCVGAVGQLVGDVDTPAVAPVHVEERGAETLDGNAAGAAAGKHELEDAGGLPAEIAGEGLLHESAVGVALNGHQPQLVATADGVVVERALSAAAAFEHLDVDVVGGLAGNVRVLCEVLYLLPLGAV